MGETFSLADCAAAPAWFYANLVMPFGETHQNAAEAQRSGLRSAAEAKAGAVR